MAIGGREIRAWVAERAGCFRPAAVHWCTGSEQEHQDLLARMVADGTLHKLNQQTHPGCHLFRSDPSDVARSEQLTFVCTESKEEAGPNNNWMPVDEALARTDALFANCMAGRTMYVVPYCLGPLASPLARCGVELTDSPYVVANIHLMTRMGTDALRRIGDSGNFVKGEHSLGDLSPARRLIMHFPAAQLIRSFGSGYGGNAMLNKKCHALRIASYQAHHEGWLAEHMLLMALETPAGQKHYIAAAFPSFCGKTNLAMLRAPKHFRGYKISTLGDDICWLRPGPDGRLWAINPESGLFGVVRGTNKDSNYNAWSMLNRDVLFTNVAVTDDNQPWWEGCSEGRPKLDWQGRVYGSGNNNRAAHPNARFTTAVRRCPSYSEDAEKPTGVPLSAIIFGGRRPSLTPLVYEAEDWLHGVMMGASLVSESTAAQSGEVGLVCRDPMAMKPFCGYNFADYWQHWLNIGAQMQQQPKIFHVNWFRKDPKGRYLWPGFSDNLRVLAWIINRCEGQVKVQRSPIGLLPYGGDIDITNLQLTPQDLRDLLAVNIPEWRAEIEDLAKFFKQYGSRLPKLFEERLRTMSNLLAAT